MSERAQREARTDYWRTQIEAWRGSGGSQMTNCKAEDLNYSQFVLVAAQVSASRRDRPTWPPCGIRTSHLRERKDR